MSGLAEILLNLGFRVSGSDLSINSACERLIRQGAQIVRGHRAENLPQGASLLVYSSAVRMDNPEVVEARRRNLPVIRRAEVLAELMRLKYGVAVAGSHGKTTTTSLIAAILEAAAFDPTVIIGGQVQSLGSGGKLGKGDFLVAETDESDRSFLLLKPTIAVVTNIDAEHLSAYSSLRDLEESFETFLNAVPFYGLAVLCIDDHRVRDLSESYRGRKITYGLSPEAAIRAVNITQDRALSSFDVLKDGQQLCHIVLPMPGVHLVLNCLAALAVGLELNVPPECMCRALRSFSGVRRRLEIAGEPCGVTVINDYGHHPTEIRATINAIRNGWKTGRLHVVFQPHRYTRTRDCFVDFLEAFAGCDHLLLTEIYPAGEEPIEGVSGSALFEALTHPADRSFVRGLDAVPAALLPLLQAGDVVLCLGAGSIGTLAEVLVHEISRKGSITAGRPIAPEVH